jgi:hypothetical protein
MSGAPSLINILTKSTLSNFCQSKLFRGDGAQPPIVTAILPESAGRRLIPAFHCRLESPSAPLALKLRLDSILINILLVNIFNKYG